MNGTILNTGDMVGHLFLNDRHINKSRAYWNCTCELCGQSKDIREDSLKSGKVISDGCYKKTKEFSNKNKSIHQIEDLTGNVYYELTVLHLAENRQGKHIMWTCLCSCGKIVDVWAANLKNGNTKTCGDYKAHRLKYMKDVWDNNLDDLTGNTYGDWLVLRRDGVVQPTRWICQCQNCGNVKSVLGSSLKNGQSKSCGCRKSNPSLEGQKIGHWSIGKRNKRLRPNGHYCTTYFCTCDCGTKRYVDEERLLRGTSLSCGCMKSKANEYIADLLREYKVNFACEYSFEGLTGPNNGLLRFDFAILDDDVNVVALIEYQGQQHYTSEEFGAQQRNITDPAKKKFCKVNNIPLFEIKYTDNIDAKLDKILTHITC